MTGPEPRKKQGLLLRIRLAAMKPVFRQIRGMTLGARVAVIDGEGRFLLVRHTYSPGWIFPGGGVERGETCLDTAVRELEEEAAITATGPLILHGIFSNHREFPGDHLAFYTLRHYQQREFVANMEIADAQFFGVEALSETVTRGSRRRIEELVSQSVVSGEW